MALLLGPGLPCPEVVVVIYVQNVHGVSLGKGSVAPKDQQIPSFS
jgi:hypothetical protein